ncbi:hypothetical protein GCM10027422_25320 [Hymenobacter arcticus]
MKTVRLAEALAAEIFQKFILIARRYCLLIENQQPVTPAVFLPQVQLLLLDLYTAALNLDWIDLQSNIDHKTEEIDLPKILRVVAEKIGDSRYYWSVFDPTSEVDTEAVCGDLLDDLGDIYKDLSHALIVFDLQTIDSQEDAVWRFKFDFVHHWSDHCVNAIRALHYFIQKMEAAQYP